MSDDYLWDGTGEPDPLVAELEDKLSELAFEPVFVIEESTVAAAAEPARKSGLRPFLLGSAVTAIAAAAATLLVWCGYTMGRQDVAAPPANEMVVGTPTVDGIPPPPPPNAADPPGPPSVEDREDADEDPPEPPPPLVADLDKSKVAAKGKTKARNKGGAPSGSSSSSSEPLSPMDPPKSSHPSDGAGKSSKGSDLDVDCILDPKACGRSSSKKPAQTGATDPALPEKLSTTDIREGIAPVKAAAKQCGARLGAKVGEKVKIKLSISGATGAVTKATAQPPHAATPLGNCVAEALKKAKFKKFRKASLGAVYPVTM